MLLAVLLLGCVEDTENKAEEVLKMVMERHEEAKLEGYKGIVTITEHLRSGVQTYEISWAVKPIDEPTKWKVEGDDVLYVCNGTTYWMYDRGERSAYRGNCSSGVIKCDYYPSIEALLKCSQAGLCNLTLEKGELSGRDCFIIQSIKETPCVGSLYEVEREILWIDKENLYPLKIEKVIKSALRTGEMRTVIMVSEYKNIEFNVSGEEFEFIPPEGTEIIEIPLPPF